MPSKSFECTKRDDVEKITNHQLRTHGQIGVTHFIYPLLASLVTEYVIGRYYFEPVNNRNNVNNHIPIVPNSTEQLTKLVHGST